jgi:hypothetical protein
VKFLHHLLGGLLVLAKVAIVDARGRGFSEVVGEQLVTTGAVKWGLDCLLAFRVGKGLIDLSQGEGPECCDMYSLRVLAVLDHLFEALDGGLGFDPFRLFVFRFGQIVAQVELDGAAVAAAVVDAASGGFAVATRATRFLVERGGVFRNAPMHHESEVTKMLLMCGQLHIRRDNIRWLQFQRFS